ncbi:MAG: hypothetical protein LM600_06145 [Thaumarchaeota archaeon]|jgi:hypothetical protein|nr:hypothetical protein [Nitrososphaerota archaeon]
MRALYGAIKTLEEKDVVSMERFKFIAEYVKSPEAKRQLEIHAQELFGGSRGGGPAMAWT